MFFKKLALENAVTLHNNNNNVSNGRITISSKVLVNLIVAFILL
jgi:hypothetical protein